VRIKQKGHSTRPNLKNFSAALILNAGSKCFNGSHWHGSALRGNHSVANRMLVAVQAAEKWDVSRAGDSSPCSSSMTRTSEGI
jgi:hypothetical protein